LCPLCQGLMARMCGEMKAPSSAATTGVILVTGGGRGIGAATARLAAQRGYAVAINYLSHADAADRVLQERLLRF